VFVVQVAEPFAAGRHITIHIFKMKMWIVPVFKMKMWIVPILKPENVDRQSAKHSPKTQSTFFKTENVDRP